MGKSDLILSTGKFTILYFTHIDLKLDRMFRCTAMQDTLFTDLQFTLKPFLDHIFDPEPQWANGNLADNLVGESIHKQHTGTLLSDSTLAEIEHRFGIELTRCRTMAALHIICIDLQEWL